MPEVKKKAEVVKLVVSVSGGCVQEVYGPPNMKFDVTIDDEDEYESMGLDHDQRSKTSRALVKGLSVVDWGLHRPATKTLLFKSETKIIFADETVRCLCGSTARQVGGNSDGYEDWVCKKCNEQFQVDPEPDK